jgi:predicted transcriptional regulator
MQVDNAPRHKNALRARHAERDPGTVSVDVTRLRELGLIDQAPDGSVSVPFDAVEILVPLARAAA